MNERIQKVKQHLSDYKTVYIVGGCVVVAGITCLIMKEPRAILRGGVEEPLRDFTGSYFSSNSLFQFGDNTVTTTFNGSKGHPGFITRCLETGELFATQGDAARAFNIPEQYLSAHLNKGFELQEGIHFERVGVLN